jgi:hypothetical protein
LLKVPWVQRSYRIRGGVSCTQPPARKVDTDSNARIWNARVHHLSVCRRSRACFDLQRCFVARHRMTQLVGSHEPGPDASGGDAVQRGDSAPSVTTAHDHACVPLFSETDISYRNRTASWQPRQTAASTNSARHIFTARYHDVILHCDGLGAACMLVDHRFAPTQWQGVYTAWVTTRLSARICRTSTITSARHRYQNHTATAEARS